jgi:hypothetical protein
VVKQFSLECEFISEFKSVSETSKFIGCNKTSIGKVSRGERKSCGGIFKIRRERQFKSCLFVKKKVLPKQD